MIDVQSLSTRIDLRREAQGAAVRAVLDGLLNRDQRGMILADEVGCGKTFEALATTALLWAHHEATSRPIQRVLIVADGPLVNKWFTELETVDDARTKQGERRGFRQYVEGPGFERFLSLVDHTTRLESLRDGDEAGERSEGRLQVPKGRIYIAKQSVLSRANEESARLVRYLKKTDWDVLILDEAHNYASPEIQRGRIFFPSGRNDSRTEGLTARYVLALTATPFQLNIRELLNLLAIVNANTEDVEMLKDALPRFERALELFYARRNLPPDNEARCRTVDKLEALRKADASDGQRPGALGLEPLLRRYLVRNVKPINQREYQLTEDQVDGVAPRAFLPLGDIRRTVRESSLIPLAGINSWLYLHVRDAIDDAAESARQNSESKRTFVAGDLRQCLSSYSQLRESSLLKKDLPSVRELSSVLEGLRAQEERHPKVAALCKVVDFLLSVEIERLRNDRAAHFQKILIFNTLIKTAGVLTEALQAAAKARLNPFIDETLGDAGWPSLDDARETVRAALRNELEFAAKDLAKFAAAHRRISGSLLEAASPEGTAKERDLVEVMFERAQHHCVQPLFLLRVARWLSARGERGTQDDVQDFLALHVTQRLKHALERIIDDHLDDTPIRGEFRDADNRARARRAISRLTHILAAPDIVGRFDGRVPDDLREQRKENFNRPYAPLILLVSKVGEEGIDLQAHTRYVLHYDIEWNPAKMEQREGRVDREGRTTRGPVQVRFFLLKDTYEERIFHTVMQRSNWFEILIGSKKNELARAIDAEEPEQPGDQEIEEDVGYLTPRERARVMLDLRP